MLGALQEVEDNLAALRFLAQEREEQTQAVAAALAQSRYEGGITTYLEVVIAQAAALSSERTAVDLQTRRLTATVNLIKALGGGWTESDLPAPRTVLGSQPASTGDASPGPR